MSEESRQPHSGQEYLGFRTFADDTPRPDLDLARYSERASWQKPFYLPEGSEVFGAEDAKQRSSGEQDAYSLSPSKGTKILFGVFALTAAALALILTVRASEKVPSSALVRDTDSVLLGVNIPPAYTSLAPPPLPEPISAATPQKESAIAKSPMPTLGTPASAMGSALAPTPTPPTPPLIQQASVESVKSLPAAPIPMAAPERLRIGVDCQGTGGSVTQVICDDAGLAALDRQMVRSYQAALAAGAPAATLRREQRDWTDARDNAAHYSQHDVADLYTERLNDLAQWQEEGATSARRSSENF
jgi:uncharacterized protein YecT (DUF1311 family)